jgi:hypothetical protein
LGEALRLCGDVPMGGPGVLQIAQQTLALGRPPPVVVMQAFSGVLAPGFNGIPQG